MAEMDVERHGWGIVNAQGTRDAPYYTDMTVSPLGADISLQERLRLESTFQPMALGGHFLPIELSEPLQDPESLLALTKDIVGSYNIGAYAFTRTYGYCYNCKKIQGGHNQKCSSCGTEEAYVTFSRLSSDYGSIDYWPKYKLNTLDSRKRYHMT
jgi:ribonucleoside-triphosphate reductase